LNRNFQRILQEVARAAGVISALFLIFYSVQWVSTYSYSDRSRTVTRNFNSLGKFEKLLAAENFELLKQASCNSDFEEKLKPILISLRESKESIQKVEENLARFGDFGASNFGLETWRNDMGTYQDGLRKNEFEALREQKSALERYFTLVAEALELPRSITDGIGRSSDTYLSSFESKWRHETILVKFLLETQPEFSDGKLLFKSDPAIDQYKRLVTAYSKATEAEVTANAKVTASITEAMNMFQDGTKLKPK